MPTWELGRSFGVTHTFGSTILGGSGKEGLRPDGRLAGEQWLAMSGEHPPIHVKGPVLATRTGCGCSQSLVQEELSPSIKPAKHLVLGRAVAWLSPLAGGVGYLSPVESNPWTDLPRGGGASPCPPGNGRRGLAHAHEHCALLVTFLEGLDLMRAVLSLPPQSVSLSALGRLRQEHC